ncbi:MAG: competence protein ComK [Bacilli bacterium]
MEKTINYFETYPQVIEHHCEKTVLHKESLAYLFSQACLRELTTLEGRIRGIKIVFGLKYNVPVYINDYLLFFKITSGPNQYWINFFQIYDIQKKDQQTLVIFKNKDYLLINKSFRIFRKTYEKAMLIADYKNGLH